MNSALSCLKGFRLPCIVVICLFFSGCEEQQFTPLFESNVIYGTITPFDANDKENFTVKAYGPYGVKSTQTDNKGFFELPGLGNGSYEIEISKDGYGAKQVFNVQLLQKDTFNIDTYMYAIPDIKMPGITSVMPTMGYYCDYEGSGSDAPFRLRTNLPMSEDEYQYSNMRFFVSLDADVSYLNYQYTFLACPLKDEGIFIFSRLKEWNINYETDVNKLSFESGQKIYIIGYPCNSSDYDGYYHDKLGFKVYSSLNRNESSDVLEYTIP